MAEAAPAALPVAAAPAVAVGRGRGKGKKKGKAKKKMAMKRVPQEGEEGYVKKEPKLSLKAQVEKELGDRDIEEVLKENRAEVDALKKAVDEAQEEERSWETGIASGKAKMAEASAAVDKMVIEETIALEKLKAARMELVQAQKLVAQKKLETTDGDRALTVLEGEAEMQQKTADLIKQKNDVQAAKEAAKKALMDAKLKEAEVAAAMKEKRAALAITDDPEAAARAKADAERAVEEEKIRREAKSAGKHADLDLKKQMRELDRQRKMRDKERAKNFKVAAGLGTKKRALADGTAASPAKAAKIHDVD